MPKSPQNYEPLPHMIITRNTKELMENRFDDYRIHYAHHILFETNGIRADIEKNSKDSGIVLRTARPGDTFLYTLVPDYNLMKEHIEINLGNIAKLKAHKELQNLKRVWVLCYDIANTEKGEPEDMPTTVIYQDPDAADINKIIKENRTILAVFIIIEYDSPETLKNPELGSSNIEWVMMSPGDINNLKEYNEFFKQAECENLKRMFYIDFSKKKENGYFNENKLDNEALGKLMETAK